MRILCCVKKIGILLFCLYSISAHADRIKDLTSVQGIRSNQLVGYGLVVGLDGTGDQTNQTPFTIQTFKNMMAQFGIVIPDGVNPTLKNVAAVSISAELPAFAKSGQTIDITISSIGNAKSLRGGSLLMTPLKGADGRVYAIAQGNLVVSGFGGEGQDGSKVSVNSQSVGKIPSGATVEREVANSFGTDPFITFNLNQSDFTTAKNIEESINKLVGMKVAKALDSTSIQVESPVEAQQKVEFISVLENLDVKIADGIAKVIINARTGTIIIGKNVKISPAAVSHGNLTVSITETPVISQPAALSKGQTVVASVSEVALKQEKNRMFLFDAGVTLGDIVRAINQVGATPNDLIAILEALKEVGALKAQLVII